MLKRLDIIKQICLLTSCTRKNKKLNRFSKPELLHLQAWIGILHDVARKELEALKGIKRNGKEKT